MFHYCPLPLALSSRVEELGDALNVLVTPSRTVQHDAGTPLQLGREGFQVGDRVGRFQGGTNSLQLRQPLKGVERLLVGDAVIFRPSGIF